jgi:hypothetical protein
MSIKHPEIEIILRQLDSLIAEARRVFDHNSTVAGIAARSLSFDSGRITGLVEARRRIEQTTADLYL